MCYPTTTGDGPTLGNLYLAVKSPIMSCKDALSDFSGFQTFAYEAILISKIMS